MKFVFYITMLISFTALANVPVPDATVEVSSLLKIHKYKGFGFIQLRVDEVGEPASQPRRLSLAVSCGKKIEKQILLSDMEICSYDSLNLDKNKKSITLNLKGYNPDNGKCEKHQAKVISIARECKE